MLFNVPHAGRYACTEIDPGTTSPKARFSSTNMGPALACAGSAGADEAVFLALCAANSGGGVANVTQKAVGRTCGKPI
jgi:hypothetical protein